MNAIILAFADHQDRFGNAFAQGLKKHGWNAKVSRYPNPCDLLVIWSTRRQDIIARQKHHGEVCILERGYLGDRFKWTSVSFGGKLNGRATFRGPFHDPSRWEKHFSHLMQPWRSKEGYVLVMGQVEGDMSVTNVNLPKFYANAEKAFKKQGYQVRHRPHPNEKTKHPAHKDGLQRALEGAAVCVTWNSNSGVDAVLSGVPTVAMDEGSMVWDVAGHELKFPPKPDRTAWAHALAWKQWTVEEIASGECWAAIGG